MVEKKKSNDCKKIIEYIIITKPVEKENKNTIKLRNNDILQAGLKKDIESLESYLIDLNWAEGYEKDSGQKLEKKYYFVNRAIRIRYDSYERELKPYTNIQGSVYYYTKAVDILYQFDKKIKELFPETEYALKIKHLTCCVLQPRIVFRKGDLKQIKKVFPEFQLPDRIDKTKYNSQVIPAGLIYKDDYSEHIRDYYDCERCDLDPNWARYKKEEPEEDLHDEFCEQKLPKRSRRSPKAHCFGTRKKERPAGIEWVRIKKA